MATRSPKKRSTGRVRTRAEFDLGLLNPQQREAVLHDDGPMLVLAGAGSGKTRVIIYRIARLMRDGVEPEAILGVTFTNKAAREMRERLAALVGPDAVRVRLSTFHSLGLAILKEEATAAGLKKGFCIYDTGDQIGLVRELLRQVKVADRRLDVMRVLSIILETKRRRLAEVQLDWGDDYELAAYDLYPRYVQQMKAFNAVDFDDLILRAQDVLRKPEPRQRWSERFQYLLVDEYQDTSPDQLELVRVLAGTRENLCVVGDDDQSIYAWRGAAVDNILNFGRHFRGTREVVLDQNYRSTGNILAAANAVIKNNPKRKEKVLWSASGAGAPVEIICCEDGEAEAEFVTDEIGKLLYDGVAHGDIAVLYRSNAQSRAFEENLAMAKVPYRVVGGQEFFDRKEVRDAVAYLSVVHNPFDEVSLRRIVNSPPRGIGLSSIESLTKHGERTGKGLWGAICNAGQVEGLSSRARHGCEELKAVLQTAARRFKTVVPGQAAPLAKQMFEQLKLRDSILDADDAPAIRARRLDNLAEVTNSLARFERGLSAGANPLAEYLTNAALSRSPEEEEAETGMVTLMTLHSAKGLEFPFVFMVGVEEETLPHRRTIELGGEIDEERRLCYVGITRAQKRLWMTWATSRLRHGRPTERGPSRFLEEIPDGSGVVRRERDAALNQEESDKMADDFFKKMRSQLGIE